MLGRCTKDFAGLRQPHRSLCGAFASPMLRTPELKSSRRNSGVCAQSQRVQYRAHCNRPARRALWLAASGRWRLRDNQGLLLRAQERTGYVDENGGEEPVRSGTPQVLPKAHITAPRLMVGHRDGGCPTSRPAMRQACSSRGPRRPAARRRAGAKVHGVWVGWSPAC